MTPLRIEPWDVGLGMEPGNYVKLEVGDTGHGMDRDTLEKIFDPYFTTKKKGEGTGLGLSIVQSIVRKYGGRISVYSEPGRGTTFHVYLPVAEGGNRAVKAPAPGAAVISGEERILLIDDVGEIVEMAKEMLERMGYRVTGHTSSTEAFEDFSRDPSGFDLVITDLTMPNLTGVELSRMMVEIRPGLPIILCSGLGESIDEKTLAASGIRRYLKKPVMFREYGEAVRQVLDEAKAASRRPVGS
jgi:CheY-like chemotaxis protein